MSSKLFRGEGEVVNPPQLVQHDGAIGAHRWCPGRAKMVSWWHQDGVVGKGGWCCGHIKQVSGAHQDDVQAHQDDVWGAPRWCPEHHLGASVGQSGCHEKLAVFSNI